MINISDISYHIHSYLLNHIKPCSILHHHCRRHRLYLDDLDLDRAWMSVHELRQVIDFAVQCHPAILWDAMAIPQWSPVLKKRGKNTSHWTVETPLRIRWKMEILEVTPHVHTPQTFINLSTPKFYKLQWSSNPGVSTGLNPGWTRIADGSTRATTSRQVTPRSTGCSERSPWRAPSWAALAWPGRPGDSCGLKLKKWLDRTRGDDVYGFWGSAFFLAFIGFTMGFTMFQHSIRLFPNDFMDPERCWVCFDPGEFTIHQQVFGCIMMYLGILRFGTSKPSSQKKNGFIYLTYLENPSPGKEMQVGTLPMIWKGERLSLGHWCWHTMIFLPFVRHLDVNLPKTRVWRSSPVWQSGSAGEVNKNDRKNFLVQSLSSLEHLTAHFHHNHHQQITASRSGSNRTLAKKKSLVDHSRRNNLLKSMVSSHEHIIKNPLHPWFPPNCLSSKCIRSMVSIIWCCQIIYSNHFS